MAHHVSSRQQSKVPWEDKPLPRPVIPEPPAPAQARRISPPDASRSPARLRKSGTGPTIVAPQPRLPSVSHLATTQPTLPNLPPVQQSLPPDTGLPESNLIPPPPIHSRNSSLDWTSRPGTPNSRGISSRPTSRPTTPSIHVSGPGIPGSPALNASPADNQKKKKHKLTKSDDNSTGQPRPTAWIVGHPEMPPYDTAGLLNGRPMQELWDEDGNCTIYLFPKESGKGPSFKVDSEIFASSPVLTKLAFGEIYTDLSTMGGHGMPLDAHAAALHINDPVSPPDHFAGTLGSLGSPELRGSSISPPTSPVSQLYVPVSFAVDGVPQVPSKSKGDQAAKTDDLQTLIDYRNFFSFLAGSSLIATEKRSSFFTIFMTIAGIMRSFQFTNIDGSTYGEIASESFNSYVAELGLADVRGSREKTIEGIVLAERMKSVMLYNEAFTHGVGKHQELMALKSPKFSIISGVTQNRLQRAALDLEKRVTSVRIVLTDFDFPFLVSGIMTSKVSEERKEGVRFSQWKDAFLGMRKYLMGLYKLKYGSWPPKASSKKNNLETSGLNRIVLQDMYRDLTSLYDFLVDRNHLTTRTIDGFDLSEGKDTPTVRGLRRVLSEYDRSAPPVKPPVPFDLPRMPTLMTTRRDFGRNADADAKAATKKLKDDEITAILRASWNEDAPVTPFVDAFREMEHRAARNCTLAEIEDLRIGQWIFVYVVLQSLPMLACDAPDLKWTRGVEYFLCEPPRSGVPWADPNAAAAGAAGRTWFSVAGASGGVVSLPSDLVEHGVEGIYRRSHCWVMAQKWSAGNPMLNEALHEQQQHHGGGGAGVGGSGNGVQHPPVLDSSTPVPPPGAGLQPDPRASLAAPSKRLSSLGLSLEALPLPAGVTPDGSAPTAPERSRTPKHEVDSTKTFDAILANVDKGKKGKKKR